MKHVYLDKVVVDGINSGAVPQIEIHYWDLGEKKGIESNSTILLHQQNRD